MGNELIEDKEKARKYSEKAIYVWREETPHYSLTLEYDIPPEEGLDEKLNQLKKEKKLVIL
jgi:hypothetical protein